MKEPVGRQTKILSSARTASWALSPSFNPQQTYNLDTVFCLFLLYRERYTTSFNKPPPPSKVATLTQLLQTRLPTPFITNCHQLSWKRLGGGERKGEKELGREERKLVDHFNISGRSTKNMIAYCIPFHQINTENWKKSVQKSIICNTEIYNL